VRCGRSFCLSPALSVATLTATALMKSALDDPAIPPQVAEMANKQEWEICDIVGKEDVDGVPHY